MTPTHKTHTQSTQDCFPNMGVSLAEKVERSIALLREHEPLALRTNPEGYWLAFSGGKYSVVIKRLAIMAGVKFKPVYNVTTIDPPELVRFIREFHPDVEMWRPKRSFFEAVAQSHGLPTRLVRWCCEEFKERYGEGYVKVFGVRAAESARRAKQWKEVTPWRNSNSFAICPIVGWGDEDVWGFIHKERLPYCSLYDEGWKRLGCIGCPMAGAGRRKEFARWPKFEKAWRAATARYCAARRGKPTRSKRPYYFERFKNSDAFFDWWMSDNPTPAEDDQECLGLFDA